ncbi:uncharacterized protein PFL1_01232 [Pseudozyma flocculosa PF-1]|nr:uncharacterized protein PFL1_01232 [Pseudozyma flocculosa PF-1]EPQ31043.1 hypothetical protein PFL1_01232 [Pseudozyma flocculosa PF-1]
MLGCSSAFASIRGPLAGLRPSLGTSSSLVVARTAARSAPIRPTCQVVERRCYSSGTDKDQQTASMGPPESYVSLSTDPFFNLAFEDHLFRTRPPQTPVCLIYRNSPCVVVGRNQNPWKELNAAAMRDAAIPLVRRQSGGGTVYHDLGNTNYSFHTPRESFDRRTHAELMVRALNSEPVSLVSSTSRVASNRGAYVNGRGDICISVRPSFPVPPSTGSDAATEWEERKISGSAYKLVNTRAYHHGTMLLSASLSSLGSSLHNLRGDALVTKGVASVRAKVANLTDAFPDRASVLDHDTVARSAVAEFWQTYAGKRGETDLVDERLLDAPELNEGRWKLRESYDELRSWGWVWGQTPEFTHRVAFDGSSSGAAAATSGLRFQLEVHSKNGIILDAKVEQLEARSDEAGREARKTIEALRGQRYDEYAVTPPWAQDPEGRSQSRLVPSSEVEADIFRWLRKVL